MAEQQISLTPRSPGPTAAHFPDPQLTSVEDMQDWLASQIAAQIGVDPDEIDIHTPFHHFGLDSVQAMGIATSGKQQLGVEISPLAMWNCPNIDALSRYLAEEIANSEVETFSI